MQEKFEKRLLIYLDRRELRPKGGMAGYNYSLNEGLKKIGAANCAYLDLGDTARSKLKGMKNSPLKRLLFVGLRLANYSILLLRRKSHARVDLSAYDAVHFHSVKDLYEARTSLEDYGGITILTTHCPKPFSCEICEDVITGFERRAFGWLYRRLSRLEDFAFHRADCIVFPCEEAEEPYYAKHPGYARLHAENRDKYRYLLTGTQACRAKLRCDEVRKSYGIGKDAFVLCYVGRHNETKGYDRLKQLGQTLLQDDGVCFLVAGSEEPLRRLEHPRWIEAGWTDDPHSLIHAADLFVLPNRQTYFDLVLLEALSLGKIVLASRTGGNRLFEKLDAPGVLLFEDMEQAARLVREVRAMEPARRLRLEAANRALYERLFSETAFAQNYVKLINSLEKR